MSCPCFRAFTDDWLRRPGRGRWSTPAGAAEKLRVGKAVAFAWTFTPLDVGMQTGIFAKHGVEIEASAFDGDARMQQALTSDSIDIGIGSGPGMAFMAKGVPAKAVAAMAGVPRNMAVMVSYNSPIQTVDDLKGKKLGVTTVGSLTDWIGKRINALKGWGRTASPRCRSAACSRRAPAIKTGQIDGYIGALEIGYALEENKEWRVITTATPFVEHFITHVFFARDDLIEKRPQAVRAFLQGWFETIAFMKANKDKTVEITVQGRSTSARRSSAAPMTSRSASSARTARSIRRRSRCSSSRSSRWGC